MKNSLFLYLLVLLTFQAQLQFFSYNFSVNLNMKISIPYWYKYTEVIVLVVFFKNLNDLPLIYFESECLKLTLTYNYRNSYSFGLILNFIKP